jgi:hypothetical protein
MIRPDNPPFGSNLTSFSATEVPDTIRHLQKAVAAANATAWPMYRPSGW